MARFVARFGKYRHGIQNGREMVLADGQRQVLRPEIIAAFRPAAEILTPEEIQYGISHLDHKGLPIDRDTEQMISPRSRLSGYDTEKAAREMELTDEEHELLVKRLRESEYYGLDFVELPESPTEKPWKTYEDTPIREVLKVATTVGVPFKDVLAYERANRKDAALILLLEDAIANDDEQKVETDEAVVIEA